VDGEDTFWKVGITGKDLKQRFNTEDRKKITVLYLYQFGNGVDAYKSEQNILKMFNVYRVKDKRKILSCGGNTELFHKDVLQMDHLGDVV